jgi:hypothetical protein
LAIDLQGGYNFIMLIQLIDFFIDFFRNINTKKIIGAIFMIVGLLLIGEIYRSDDLNEGMQFLFAGVFVAGIGTVIIYHDIAADKAGTPKDDLELIAKAYEKKEIDKKSSQDPR